MTDGIGLKAEIDRNYDAFQTLLPLVLSSRRGMHALLRHQTIIDFFGSPSAALAAGRERFRDGLYSVQEVTDRPADLGFFSHAIHPRLA